MGKSIVVTSGKGGTGKTSITSGVASCLAALGKKVVCIDADVGLRNLDIALGLSEKALFDFNDVLLGRKKLRDAIVEHPDIPNLSMLSAPVGITPSDIKTSEFKMMVDDLSEQVDFVFVDCPAGLDSGFALAAASCKRAIVVVNPDALSIRDGARTAARLIGCETAHVVVNRIRPKMIYRQYAANIDDIIDTVGLPLLGIVPEDEIVMAAANKGIAIVLTAKTGAPLAYLNIAERLLGNQVKLMKMKEWKVDN